MNSYELKKAFNFGDRILQIYQLEQSKETHKNLIDGFDRQIEELKNELPDEIISLYEQQRVIDKLTGLDTLAG